MLGLLRRLLTLLAPHTLNSLGNPWSSCPPPKSIPLHWGGHWEATQEAVLLLGLPNFGGSHLERNRFSSGIHVLC